MILVVHRELVGAVHFSLWPNALPTCVDVGGVDERVHSEIV